MGAQGMARAGAELAYLAFSGDLAGTQGRQAGRRVPLRALQERSQRCWTRSTSSPSQLCGLRSP